MTNVSSFCKALLIPLISLQLASCGAHAPLTRQHYENLGIHTGMTTEAAKELLERNGFGCFFGGTSIEEKRNGIDDYLICKIYAGSFLLSSCTQGIYMKIAKNRVAIYEAEKPLCVGL